MRIWIVQMKRQQVPFNNSPHSPLRPPGRRIFFSSLTLVLILTFPPVASGAARAVWCRDACAAADALFCAPLTLLPLSPHRRHSPKECQNPASCFPSERSQPMLAYIGPRSCCEVHLTFWSVWDSFQKHQSYHQQEQRQRRRQPVNYRRHGVSSVFDCGQGRTESACSNFPAEFWGGCTRPGIPNPRLSHSLTATVAQAVHTQEMWLQCGESALRQYTCCPRTVASDRTTWILSCLSDFSNVPQPPVDNSCGAHIATASANDACPPVQSIDQPVLPEVKSATGIYHGSEQHPRTTAPRKTETPISSSVANISRDALPDSGHRVGVKDHRGSNTGSKAELSASTRIEGKTLLSSLPQIPTEESSCPRRLLAAETAEETSIAADHWLPFPRLGLFPNFVEALKNLGVRTATEIQQLCLPAILSGADVVLGAETGSGKTLGYLLGVLQNVLIQKIIHEQKEDEAMVKKDELPLPRHYPYALIVVPTRELALQVVAWSRRLCKETPISTQLLLGSYTRWPFGTLTLPISPDVILCTPQVLAGFASNGSFRRKHASIFQHTQMLVLDEADMLLEGGYKKMMESVFSEFRKTDRMLASSGKRRTQYVFAAATIPDRGPMSIRKTIAALCPEASFLCADSLHRQRRELQQDFIEIPAHASFDARTNLLLDKLRDISLSERVMIFCNTAHTAKRVLQELEEKLPPAANPKLFSSDLDQRDRARNLALFAREKSKVLVCTDAASRGLDIVGVTNVIQFDFALNAMTHLHRVGRVARAGRFGKAINFYDPINKPLVDAVRQAAWNPARSPLTDAFSRKRSFRKSLKKADDSSSALVVDYPSPAVAVP